MQLYNHFSNSYGYRGFDAHATMIPLYNLSFKDDDTEDVNARDEWMDVSSSKRNRSLLVSKWINNFIGTDNSSNTRSMNLENSSEVLRLPEHAPHCYDNEEEDEHFW